MTTSPTVDLTIVVPVYNEEDNVEPLHEEVSAAVSGIVDSYELIVVDDGSQDRTVDRLRALAERDPNLKVLCFSRNFGQTAAIQAGFDHARGRTVITMDGDLQNDPADIGRLLTHLDEGFEVVSGWRQRRQDRLVSRRIPSIVANWVIGRLTGVRIQDNGCTLKAYRAEVVKRTHLYGEMHRFLAPMLSLSGCRYKEVVVNHRERQFGTSKYGLSRIWKVLLDLLTIKMILRFASHPAPWFTLLGVPLIGVAVLATLASAILYLRATSNGEFPIVIPAIAVLCSFVATHLVLFGMFAELVVQKGDYHETDPIVVTVEGEAQG